jgi:hypothetical protein
MATTYKILGQSAPAGTSNVDLYTVPADTQTVVSTLFVTNVTAAAAICRIYVRKNGAAASDSNALVKDGPVGANDFKAVTTGITLDAGDIITVQSGTASALTFHLYGSEVA